ncbi:hypothetical protein [Nocardioides sp.]|uniref:hypothetical protein n=1 Tax=Nocardioides sp. TaxID=35761 RepID=UPI0031FF25D8|nr:hypothetical protein [Nocardioides sp.]
MSTPLRVAAFVAGLAAFFALAFGVGNAVGPLDVKVDGHEDMGGADMSTSRGDEHAGMDTTTAAAVGGLQTSEDGYTLALEDGRLPAGRQPVAFTITGPDGHPVTAYDEQHEKDLHLIVVGRDLHGFQHVHPVLDAAGRWSTVVDLTPGAWRVIADFTPTGGDPLVLGSDLLVPGRSTPAGLGPDRRTATVGRYDVSLGGDLVAGQESELTLTVRKDGAPVTDLDPYLGAYGHLVALRAGDLAYLHVHPDGGPGDVAPGPAIVFHAEVPSNGAYRLFLDFRHDDVVRTAAFTVHVGGEAGHEH